MFCPPPKKKTRTKTAQKNPKRYQNPVCPTPAAMTNDVHRQCLGPCQTYWASPKMAQPSRHTQLDPDTKPGWWCVHFCARTCWSTRLLRTTLCSRYGMGILWMCRPEQVAFQLSVFCPKRSDRVKNRRRPINLSGWILLV